MIDIIEELEMINAVTDGFPFLCPICAQERGDWDYLRIHLKGNPNPRCIHLKCLLNQVGFSPEEIERVTKVSEPMAKPTETLKELVDELEEIGKRLEHPPLAPRDIERLNEWRLNLLSAIVKRLVE